MYNIVIQIPKGEIIMLKNTKLGIALTTLALTIALGATSIFAAGNYVDLIPADDDALAEWRIANQGDNGSATIKPEIKDGKLILTNDGGSYPSLVAENLDYEFDASKKVYLDYEFTLDEGVQAQIALYNGASEFKLSRDYYEEQGDLQKASYKDKIDLTAGKAAEILVKDGKINITQINLYSMYGSEKAVTFTKLAIYEEGAEPGGNEPTQKPTETQKPTDSSKPTDTTKPGNNQTSDAAMALPLVIAAAAAFGGIKLRKSK